MNGMLNFTLDYSTPLIDRVNCRSRQWYLENREKALDYYRRLYKKQKFEANPKWKKAYGGI